MNASQFVGQLFLGRNVAHSVHLNTRSYSKHKALGHFYEDVIELADKFAEAYQGRHGLIGPIAIPASKKTTNIVEFLQEQVAEIEKCRYDVCEKQTLRSKTSLMKSSGCICQPSTNSAF